MDKQSFLFNLEYLLVEIDKIRAEVENHFGFKVSSDDVIGKLNQIIDGCVQFNKHTDPIVSEAPNQDLSNSILSVFDSLEAIVEGFNSEDYEGVVVDFNTSFTPRFRNLRKVFDNYVYELTGLKKVLVVGLNTVTYNIQKLIDNNKGKVIAYVSNDISYVGEFYSGAPIIHPTEMELYSYDIVISTDEAVVPTKAEIVDLHLFLSHYYDFELFRAFSNYMEKTDQIEGFITGLSYAEVGIDTTVLGWEAVNVAVSSQDLFYDYHWAKHILEKDRHKKIKKAIIGLSYYSFEYDLTKGNMKDKALHYLPLFGLLHNHFDKKRLIEEFTKYNSCVTSIMKKDYEIELFTMLKHMGDSWWSDFVSRSMTVETANKGPEQAKKDGAKNYPCTVEENVEILDQYLTLLKTNEIDPIIVVFPTSKSYSSNFPERMINEFYVNLNRVNKKYGVKVFDYFLTEELDDSHFYEASHLNKNGATRFTKMLNADLEGRSH